MSETKPERGVTRIHNEKTGSTYRLRTRSTKKGEEGSILGKWKPPMSIGRLRCGLCQVKLPEGETWQQHLESDLHKSSLPDPIKFVAAPVYPVKEISEKERKNNKREGNVAHAEFLGYHSVANGKSYDRMLCECGEVSDVFRWRGCKRCSNCWKLLHNILSYSDKDISMNYSGKDLSMDK